MNAAPSVVDPLILGAHQRIFMRLVPPRKRTYREFAESEIIIPNGPLEGSRFNCAFRPWVGEVLDEFGRGLRWRFFSSGPTQDGKTLVFFVIPAVYHLCELEEDILLCAPTTEAAQAAYRQRLLPIIKASRYKDILPKSGSGSKGGKAPEIVFENGRSVRFIGAGGGDAQRSGWTAKAVFMTELDKMDDAGEASEESDPVTQMQARASAFMESGKARIFGECTMSTEQGFVYREVSVIGTGTKLYLPCPNCGEYVYPERKDFVGWSGAATSEDASRLGHFVCPLCQTPWSEEGRRKSLDRARLVARGQSVGKDGVVVGPEPETDTYGLTWNAMASKFKRTRDIAAAEWRAEFTGKEADKKAVVQFWWAEPWKEDLADLSRPEVATILSKIVGHPRGVVPPDTVKLTLGVDVGSYVIWWTLVAWKADAQGHVVDFGGLDVPLVNGIKNPTAVLAALRTFREQTIKPGWGGRRPDRILIDSGYETDAVYEFVKESGQPRYLACKGFGTASRHGGWRDLAAAEPSPTKTVGSGYYSVLQPSGIHLVHVHSDHWKAAVHDGFWAGHGAPGSLTLLSGERADPELRKYARQVVAEQRVIRTVGEKESRVVWVVQQRQNHFLDTTAYARCAAEIEGVRMVATAQPRPKPPQDPGGSPRLKWSRDRY
jgi:phage terminase large subunit GpA-like protein